LPPGLQSEIVRPMLILIATMLDGSVWHIPANRIAESRAKHLHERHIDDPEYAYDKVLAEVLADPDDLMDWATNDTNWSDVEDVATQVVPPRPIDMQDAWVRADLFISSVE
jgi:hypothetical protein